MIFLDIRNMCLFSLRTDIVILNILTMSVIDLEQTTVDTYTSGVKMLGARVPAGTKLLSRELNISS